MIRRLRPLPRSPTKRRVSEEEAPFEAMKRPCVDAEEDELDLSDQEKLDVRQNQMSLKNARRREDAKRQRMDIRSMPSSCVQFRSVNRRSAQELHCTACTYTTNDLDAS